MPSRFLAAAAILTLAGGVCLTPLLADPPDEPPPTDAGGAGAGPGAPAAPAESAEDELRPAAEAGAGAGYGGSFGNEYGGGDEEAAFGAGLGGFGEDPFGAGPGALGSMTGEGDFGDYERGVPSLPIQLSADDFAAFLVGGFGGDEDVQLAVVRREELDGGARIVLTNGDAPSQLYYIPAYDFAVALERVGRPVNAEPGTTFEPRRRIAAGSEIWPLSKFEQFLDGQMPEYVSALVYRDFLTATRGGFEAPGRLLPVLLEPRYGTKERRVRVRRDDLRSALENFGLTLEVGRTYRPEDGSREMRWDEEDVSRFLAGRTEVIEATITAIGDRNVAFAAKLRPTTADQPGSDQPGSDQPGSDQPGSDQPETVRRTVLADHVKRAFGAAGLPSEAYAVGYVLKPVELAGDDSGLSQLLRRTSPTTGSFSIRSLGVRSVGYELDPGNGRPPITGTATREALVEALTEFGWDVPAVLRRQSSPMPGPESDPPGSAPPPAAADDLSALVAAVRDADDAGRSAAASKLREALAARFDAAQEDRETDLAALEAKVARLREMHDKRAAAKAEIVARRLDTLLRDAEGLGWGEPETN